MQQPYNSNTMKNVSTVYEMFMDEADLLLTLNDDVINTCAHTVSETCWGINKPDFCCVHVCL